MPKAAHGEYSAFINKNSVRYQKDNKLIGVADVPPAVVEALNKQLGYEPKPVAKPVAKFPRPTEEQLAKLRAESLEVPEHLQRQEPLTPQDFGYEDETPPDGLPLDADGHAPLPRTDEPVSPGLDADFLEQVSIHSASLADIAEALYNRFGLYSVYLGTLPNADEINPLTGEPFTKYHLGVAYQAALRAQNTGILTRPPEEGRRMIDQGREASANFQQQFVPAPKTMGEARRADSFEYRTSARATQDKPTTEIVHVTNPDGTVSAVQREIPRGQTGEFNGAKAQFDEDEDQPLVVPQFGKQVIRPDW